MLEVEDLEVRYGAVPAVRGVSLEVGTGELGALLGANGAGKSCTLMAIAGAVRPASGRVRLGGQDVTGARPERVARLGLATVPETRDVFPDLTVEENLRLGAFLRRRDPTHRRDWDELLARFPVLAE